MKINSKPLVETYKLTSDPEGVAEVLVRQAREGENIERAQLFAKTRYVNDGLSAAAEQDINPRRLRRKEAYLVLGRVTGITDEVNRELFKSAETDEGPSVRQAMSESEFNKAWDKLYPAMTEEISRLVFAMNPTWNPAYEGE